MFFTLTARGNNNDCCFDLSLNFNSPSQEPIRMKNNIISVIEKFTRRRYGIITDSRAESAGRLENGTGWFTFVNNFGGNSKKN